MQNPRAGSLDSCPCCAVLRSEPALSPNRRTFRIRCAWKRGLYSIGSVLEQSAATLGGLGAGKSRLPRKEERVERNRSRETSCCYNTTERNVVGLSQNSGWYSFRVGAFWLRLHARSARGSDPSDCLFGSAVVTSSPAQTGTTRLPASSIFPAERLCLVPSGFFRQKKK